MKWMGDSDHYSQRGLTRRGSVLWGFQPCMKGRDRPSYARPWNPSGKRNYQHISMGFAPVGPVGMLSRRSSTALNFDPNTYSRSIFRSVLTASIMRRSWRNSKRLLASVGKCEGGYAPGSWKRTRSLPPLQAPHKGGVVRGEAHSGN